MENLRFTSIKTLNYDMLIQNTLQTKLMSRTVAGSKMEPQ